MARSVVLNGSPRCERCRMSPRWCICSELRTVSCDLQVDVLMHEGEYFKPTSTGHLIHRLVPGTRLHLAGRHTRPDLGVIPRPDQILWILHPAGDPLPEAEIPANLQVLLLDGNWRQAASLLHECEPLGRKVSLPMTGLSRYWLRTQSEPGRFSTVEALMFLLRAVGQVDAFEQLRLQFELHVYAGLCARGRAEEAARFLMDSPVKTAFPQLSERLTGRKRG